MGLIASLVGVGLTSAGVPGARAESALEKIKDQGSIRMGFANENPFSYTTAEGELAGVDVDILRHILADMGVKKIEGGLTTFGDLIPGLQDEQFDLIASAIYIKLERCALVAFGEPLYIQGDGIVVAAAIPRASRVTPTWPPTRRSSSAIPPGHGPERQCEGHGGERGQPIDFPGHRGRFRRGQGGEDRRLRHRRHEHRDGAPRDEGPGLERADPFEQPVVDGKVRYGITSPRGAPRGPGSPRCAQPAPAGVSRHPEYLAILEKYGLTAAELPPADMPTAKICAG